MLQWRVPNSRFTSETPTLKVGMHATVNKQCFEVKGLTRELAAMLPTSKPDLLLYCPLLTCPLPTVPISSWL